MPATNIKNRNEKCDLQIGTPFNFSSVAV